MNGFQRIDNNSRRRMSATMIEVARFTITASTHCRSVTLSPVLQNKTIVLNRLVLRVRLTYSASERSGAILPINARPKRLRTIALLCLEPLRTKNQEPRTTHPQSFGTASPPDVFSARTICGDSTNQCQAEAIEDNRSTLFQESQDKIIN